MSQDNININVTENIDQVNIVASEIVEVVDLNLYATTEDVSINVTEEIIQVNVNKVTATEQIQSDWNQTNTDALDFIKNKPTIPEAITNTSELINDGADGVNPFITLEDIPAPITIDAVPTDGSSNAVSSNGVFDALATKQNTIGFTPENVANKATNLTSPDNTKYPTTQAVVDGLATKQNVITNPVTGTGANGQVAFWNGANSQTGDNGLFWDNTNKRLGVGTVTPQASLGINGETRIFDGFSPGVGFPLTFNNTNVGLHRNNNMLMIGGFGGIRFTSSNTNIFSQTERMRITDTGNVAIGATTAGARLDVRAQGALSTDIAFRVRNSADTANIFQIRGDGQATFNNSLVANGQSTFNSSIIATAQVRIGSSPIPSSAQLDVQSTTKGFLPPRMTNAQRLAIASPAVGLMVYCTDATEGLYINKSTGWTFII